MEAFLDALGTVTLVLLVVIGLLSGFIAGTLTGRHRLLYMILGLAGALLLPFVLAALGLGILAAYGAVAILIASLVGAVIVVLVARALFD
jgi:uncharacterized membrane protein YeaQ/YmgE (transglycosylase-associated protein family)